MAHNHIGIPKFIEKGFSENDKTFVYDTVRKKCYSMSIDRLGTKNNYYSNDVEKNILSHGIEKEFSKLYNDFCGTTNLDLMTKILNENKKLVEQFFSFMFMRSKKTLNNVNKESLFSNLFGDIDHSELLRNQLSININPLTILGDSYTMFPIVNFSNQLFINNSIGFGFMSSKEKEYSFIIPLNNRVAILISGVSSINNMDYFYIERTGDIKADLVNKAMCKVEKECGNGFIFSTNIDDMRKYGVYIETVL